MTASPANPTKVRGETILSVDNLVKHFPITQGVLFQRQIGAVKAVDGVSFELRRGETLGVVGESGCGKSTLARLLMRLETPTSGRATLEGKDLFKASGGELRRLRRNMQMVMQDPYTSLNPRMTVGDIIGEPFEIHPDAAPKGSRPSGSRSCSTWSGSTRSTSTGTRTSSPAVSVSASASPAPSRCKPEVIVCDEPVSALDVSIQAQVINLLKQLQDELGLSYIFIAHDLSVVRHIADRVAVMYLGRIVEIGTEDEIYERATHPYTQALLSAVPVPDPEARDQRNMIRLVGDVPSPADPPSGCHFRTRCWKAQDICAVEDPATVPRAADPHPSACHFAELRPTTRSLTRQPTVDHGVDGPFRPACRPSTP